MNYMFENGFLGTRAPLFMDFVTIIVAFLPLLVALAILLAKNKKYKAHGLAQTILFIISIIVVSYFEYGVRLAGGFKNFMDGSGVDYSYALIVLIVHIIIATSTLVLWIMTMYKAVKKKPHKSIGMKTYLGIFLTSATGIWVYMLLFVY